LIVRMTLVPSFFTLLRERTWYIPGWLDRLLPNLTVEAPHDGESRRAQPAQPAAKPIGER
jgi:RND superfamily putative drug exporter